MPFLTSFFLEIFLVAETGTLRLRMQRRRHVKLWMRQQIWLLTLMSLQFSSQFSRQIENMPYTERTLGTDRWNIANAFVRFAIGTSSVVVANPGPATFPYESWQVSMPNVVGAMLLHPSKLLLLWICCRKHWTFLHWFQSRTWKKHWKSLPVERRWLVSYGVWVK